jgi:hypothetical protein
MRRLFLSVLGLSVFLASCGSKANNVVILDSLPLKEDSKQNVKSVYQEELEKRITALLKEPVTPLRAPDTIMRVLFLPYASEDGSLVSSHYVYFKVKEGSWILGDYLIGDNKAELPKVVKPLNSSNIGGVVAPVNTPSNSGSENCPICKSNKSKGSSDNGAVNIEGPIKDMAE